VAAEDRSASAPAVADEPGTDAVAEGAAVGTPLGHVKLVSLLYKSQLPLWIFCDRDPNSIYFRIHFRLYMRSSMPGRLASLSRIGLFSSLVASAPEGDAFELVSIGCSPGGSLGLSPVVVDSLNRFSISKHNRT
jgi:hypothetical protein